MSTAIAILTYNRINALKNTLFGLLQHCDQHRIGIFEDCGQRDGTESYLRGNTKGFEEKEIMAIRHESTHIGEKVQAFLGICNLGVAGNSNRALRWFTQTGCEHLILMNDDLHVLGDFVNFYKRAHTDLNVGMFSFCDFTHHPSYQWITVNSRGYQVKLCPRMTGIMMSMTRKVVETIGYFDSRFGKFGEEHCDYMNRARLARFIDLDGQMQPQIDLEPKRPLLKHQDVETSVTGAERIAADQEASATMRQVASRYGLDPIYRPYQLRLPKMTAGIGGVGIPAENLEHYAFVDAPA